MEIKQISSSETVNLALDTIGLDKQALVFAESKLSAEKAAEDIAKKVKGVDLKNLSNRILKSLSSPTRQCRRLAFCISRGIAFHHAGLVAKQREIIEDAFRKGDIKIICATPTLCLSRDSMIWHGTSETEVSKFRNSNPLFVLSRNKLIIMKSQKVQRIENSSKLIQISSVSGYSIKVTPNHKILVKRGGKRQLLRAQDVKKSDKVATIGKLNIAHVINPSIKDFIIDNKTEISNYDFGPKLSYFIGMMLGDGYSGAEMLSNKIKYKGSPSIVGIDDKIFSEVEKICKFLGVGYKKIKNYNGTPQLILGKNKWFREFLVRCGVEKRDKKHISKKLMGMDLENTVFLLRGLFDTDGYLEKKVGPGFSNISEKLIRQIQKLLLRFGIVSSIRRKKESCMKIYDKEYKTVPCFELNIRQKKSILDFYRFIGFNLERKQKDLISLVAKICSNLNYVSCKNCDYKVYKDVFSGRSKNHKKWGKIKCQVIKLLGEKGELRSNELVSFLGCLPRNKENRLNHHYEFIKKRKIGSKSKTEWFWSLNEIGQWVYENLVKQNKNIIQFFQNRNCPLCETELDFFIKKGWRDSDFDGDIFWDMIREVKEVSVENEVYDVVLPSNGLHNHLFVANGFIVHNSMGIDLPAFRVINRSLRRYSGRWGMDWLPVLEVYQMWGRAGRPKFHDKFGEAIAVAKTSASKDEIHSRYILGEPEEIYSKLAVEPVLRTYLLSLIATGFVRRREQIIEFFANTFWAYQYKDMGKLEMILMKMLNLLEEWEFVDVAEKKRGFTLASNLENGEVIKATPLGRRVAELYIDPYTANHLIKGMRRASSKRFSVFSFLQLISHTLEMRPLLRVKTKEYEGMQEKLVEHYEELLENEPTVYDSCYDEFMNSIKTALFLEEWVEEKGEDELLDKYGVRPGEIRAKLELGDWLLYSAEEMCKLLQFRPVLKEILKLRVRLKNGVKEELLPLLRLKGIGRVRARRLFRNGIRDLGGVKKADLMTLSQILGKKVAADVKRQMGDKVVEVPKGRRKGQLGLGKYKN